MKAYYLTFLSENGYCQVARLAGKKVYEIDLRKNRLELVLGFY
jgi:hypothetical protein